MRIGELAALAGVSTRTVRHYHRIGLLPEPERQPNGYREYGLRHAVELARIRRLAELGLSLDEVGDVLADDAGKELHEVLSELDADLARQQQAIGERRARLAELLKQAERDGFTPEGPVSPELAAIFGEMARISAQLPGPESAMAAKERELLAMLETASPDETGEWLGTMQAAFSGPEAMRQAYEIYAQMDELAEAGLDDPRVEEVAQAIAGSMPEEMLRGMTDVDMDAKAEKGGFVAAFFADMAPAQGAAVRRAIALMQERAR